MAKKPTAAQIAARKKFVAAVRAGKFRKPKKKAKAKKVTRKLTAVRKKVVVAVRRVDGSPRYKKVKRKTVTVDSLKSRIREKLNDQLKEQLFKRDKATTYKQHRTAQLKIDKIRKDLRKQS